MAKNSLEQIQKLQLPGLEDALMEHPIFQRLKEYQKPISYALIALILGVVLLYRLLAGQTAKAEIDYIHLSESSAVLNNPDSSFEKRQTALNEMHALLDQYPQVQAKYDGMIAQQLLIEKKFEEATPLIDRTFSRVASTASPYDIAYAKTSLLLAEGKTDEGLKEAYLLRQKMLEEIKPFGGVLFAFNLIRITLLEKQLQHNDLELKAWNELKDMANSSYPVKISPQELQRVMTHFDNEGAKLSSFIN